MTFLRKILAPLAALSFGTAAAVAVDAVAPVIVEAQASGCTSYFLDPNGGGWGTYGLYCTNVNEAAREWYRGRVKCEFTGTTWWYSPKGDADNEHVLVGCGLGKGNITVTGIVYGNYP